MYRTEFDSLRRKGLLKRRLLDFSKNLVIGVVLFAIAVGLIIALGVGSSTHNTTVTTNDNSSSDCGFFGGCP
jgi:hypothetical protein